MRNGVARALPTRHAYRHAEHDDYVGIMLRMMQSVLGQNARAVSVD
jgi:hypothetical protein